MQRRLAAILVADVVGYSRLMETDEASTVALLRERTRSILNPTVGGNSGRIVKFMGDGVLVEFASAINAVTAALQLQQRMTDANADLPESRHIVVRVGINLGDVIGDGQDVYGDCVNIAARLEALANPGGICISAKVYEEIAGKLECTSRTSASRSSRIFREKCAPTVGGQTSQTAAPRRRVQTWLCRTSRRSPCCRSRT
jgi:adenylate cyclase